MKTYQDILEEQKWFYRHGKRKRLKRGYINGGHSDFSGENKKYCWHYNNEDELLGIREKGTENIHQVICTSVVHAIRVIEYLIREGSIVRDRVYGLVDGSRKTGIGYKGSNGKNGKGVKE